MRIVFFGNEKLATGAHRPTAWNFKALLESNHQVAGLVTTPGRRPANQVESLAKSRQIPIFQPQIGDLAPLVEKLQPGLGVLVAYGKIIPRAVLELFPGGIINIHPSLLPKYRGPTPIEQAILDGVQQTGVSLMKVTEKMDAGPIYKQEEVALEGKESKRELAERLAQAGSRHLIEVIAAVKNNDIDPRLQDEAQATYTSLLEKEDGVIDWRQPAARLEREVRAFLGWPGSRAEILGQEVIITKVRVLADQPQGAQHKPGAVSSKNNRLVVNCGEGALLIEQLKPAGKQSMSGKDFLAGYNK